MIYYNTIYLYNYIVINIIMHVYKIYTIWIKVYAVYCILYTTRMNNTVSMYWYVYTYNANSICKKGTDGNHPSVLNQIEQKNKK